MRRAIKITGWLAAALLVGAIGARAQTDTGFTLSSPMYDVTFGRTWSKVFDPSFLGKNGGLEGLAYVGCEPGSALPDADSQAVFYSEILGGHITKGAAKDTT